MFSVFRIPKEEDLIVCGADPTGDSGDPNFACWKSKKLDDCVMHFHARMESTQFGVELFKGSQYIKNHTGIYPVIAVERNTGIATIAKLIELNYPSLFRMVTFNQIDQKEEEKIGWHTNNSTRNKMLDDLAMSFRQQVNKVPDKKVLDECLTFVRNAKNGKPEAESGTHDDRVIGEAIAWQMHEILGVEDFDILANGASVETPEWAQSVGRFRTK